MHHNYASSRAAARGGEVFNEFFRKYDIKLNLDPGGRAKPAAGDACSVSELDNYCRRQVRC